MKKLETLALMALMALMAASAAATPLEAEPQENTLDRVRLSAEILARWSGGLQDGGAELRGVLARISPEALAAAARAESPAEVDAALFGRPGPLAFGDDDSDLVYFPLTPCRLVDTRAYPGGPSPLVAGTSRAFEANNNLDRQGGSAAGCGIPQADPAALAVTITAVNPQGPGNLRAYPNGAAVPSASVVNYALPGSGLNLANTTILPLRQSFDPYEFDMRADVSTVHVVVDVVGYFHAPLRAPLACSYATDSAPVPPSSDAGLIVNCPAGTNQAGGGFNLSAGLTIKQSRPATVGQGWACIANNSTGSTRSVACYVWCCTTPGR